MPAVIETFLVALRLGLTSFGGPIAHLSYFRAEYVERRGWLDDRTYAELVAICQFLPGPASSKVGIAIGTLRAGLLGGLAAWIGFTLPSAVALTAFAYGVGDVDPDAGWLRGLAIVAVAVVAQAGWVMARMLAPDRARGTIAIAVACLLLLWTTALTQVAAMLAAALIGWWFLRRDTEASDALPLRVPISRRFGIALLGLFGVLLAGLPLAAGAGLGGHALEMSDAFYRAGSLVFGGGHVVLPLLEQSVVDPGWVTQEQFVAGYGAAQAVPGPLFTFSAYLGAVQDPGPNGALGAALATVMVFLPGALLVLGALPLWNRLRDRPGARATLAGVNAGVVGLLLAALWDPLITTAIRGSEDVAIALGAFGLLQLWKLPPWLVVALAAGAGMLAAEL